ncbi:ribonuclease H1 [Octopus bimaculoides]|uniref:Ribonuclease H1 n=1 Tax=Octopus bimaculoides TaxID=37653 RepID=A0A0L8IBQ0_OCTBM|nr:ribonuclease H1 [Octopus bimaculoides]|eukprot:XP_014778914.1 PREDICTED: ribonuclease H1-like [Octopus bimaculoides]
MTSVAASLLRRPTSTLNTLKFACCLDNFIVMPFYAVKKGRVPGVYETWTECQEQINGFYGAKFKKFNTEEEALAFADISPSDKTLSSVAKSIQPIVKKLMSRVKEVSPLCQTLVSMLADLDDSEDSKEFSTLACNVENDLAKLTASVKLTIDSKLLTGTTKRKASDSSENTPEPPEKKKCVEEGGFSGKKFADDDGVVVYTDGCCFHNGKHGASAGLGIYWGEGEKNTSERLDGRQTNNRAEIHAAIRAVEQAKAKNISNLIVKTDSQFLINCITKWLEGWKKKNWMKSSGEEVINKEDLQELDEKLEGINVKWVHVDAHCGVAGNEAADKLANKGAKLPLPK